MANSDEREFEGKDLEEALQAAATRLKIHEPDLDYKILEQGRRGLFGFGARSVGLLRGRRSGLYPDLPKGIASGAR